MEHTLKFVIVLALVTLFAYGGYFFAYQAQAGFESSMNRSWPAASPRYNIPKPSIPQQVVTPPRDRFFWQAQGDDCTY